MNLQKWLRDHRKTEMTRRSGEAKTKVVNKSDYQVLVLVVDANGHLLVSVRKAEGNSSKKIFLLGPTVQTVEKNLETVENGDFPARSTLVDNEKIKWFYCPGDDNSPPSRVGILSDKMSVNKIKGEKKETEFWTTFAELKTHIQNGNVNPQLLRCLAVAHYAL